MFINTKNNTLAAIISLSLLMASMPVKAENNTNKYAKKTARCAWHVAKIVAGVLTFRTARNLKQSFVEQKEVIDLGMGILGPARLNLSGGLYFPNLHNDPSQDKISELGNAAQKQEENEQTVNSNLFLIKTLSLAPIISGCVGLAQECGLLSQESKTKEDNENQSMKNNFS